MAPLPPREQRHPFLSYQGLKYTYEDIADFKERLERIYSREIHRVQVVDFQGMPKLLRDGLFARIVMEHRDDAGLHTEEEMESPDFARRFAAGRKSRAHISGGQFVARLAKHFGLLTTEILGELTVIVLELSIIDMGKLVRLQICMEVDDTWAWVAIGPERQPNAAIGALAVVEDAPTTDEGNQVILTPVQAPQQPPLLLSAAARTMPQRLGRLEEEVQGLCRDIGSLHGLMERSMTDQGKFSTWMMSYIAQLMDASGLTYQAFDGTFRGSSPAAFQRRTRIKPG
ncbi:hypothetical protein Tco_0540036, partial [Tanacetum coccineum]